MRVKCKWWCDTNPFIPRLTVKFEVRGLTKEEVEQAETDMQDALHAFVSNLSHENESGVDMKEEA